MSSSAGPIPAPRRTRLRSRRAGITHQGQRPPASARTYAGRRPRQAEATIERANSPKTTRWSRQVNLMGTPWWKRDNLDGPRGLARPRGFSMTAEMKPEVPIATRLAPGSARPTNDFTLLVLTGPRLRSAASHRKARQGRQGPRQRSRPARRYGLAPPLRARASRRRRLGEGPRLDQRHAHRRLQDHRGARSRPARSCRFGEVEVVVRATPAEGRRAPFRASTKFGPAIGESLAMRTVFGVLERIAPTDGTVLLEGETGTGKDVLARAIHLASPRAKAPFVVVDCGAVSYSLIESELFGHERGAFTGAVASRRGRVRDRRRRARCSSTRSASCRSTCSPSSCACSRRASSGAWAATRRSRRRARHRRHQARSQARGRARQVPRRPLFPPGGGARHGAAAAHAPRGHPRPRAALSAAGSQNDPTLGPLSMADDAIWRSPRTIGRATCASSATCSSARSTWRAPRARARSS